MKLLWNNPNPTATFATQTITLSSDDYDYLKIFYRYNTAYNRDLSIDVLKGDSGELNSCYVTATGFGLITRHLTYVSDTEYTVSNHMSATATTAPSVSTAMNGVGGCIPLAIYGCKF
ncbi:MAG: hypothetical protein IJP31_04550 [Lachnospiraceae bacterium]|nr:hypothetical protein [Lachnospiraceae bacterium]